MKKSCLVIIVLLIFSFVACDGEESDYINQQDFLSAETAVTLKDGRTGQESFEVNSEKNIAENIVVKNPKYNQVTKEIDENLVGKFVVKDDPEMYFEIKHDGSVEISLNAMTGYAKYNGGIGITAFYQYSEDSDFYRNVLSFTLISGEHTFPGSFLSLDFESTNDTRYMVFTSITFWAGSGLKFVKIQS